MGGYKRRLKCLIADGMTSPPPVPYSFRHKRRSINYKDELAKPFKKPKPSKQSKKQGRCSLRSLVPNGVILPRKRGAQKREAEDMDSSNRDAPPEKKHRNDSTGVARPIDHLGRANVERISSVAAAKLISQAPRDLLVITTDGSAGGTSGSAAVLRLLNGRFSHDSIRAVVKYHPWAEAGPAEVAAVALGCDAALKDGVAAGRRVLIIMDSQHTFYHSSDKIHNLDQLVEADDFQESMTRLVKASKSVMITDIKSRHGAGGFCDHKLADKLAGMARDEKKASAFRGKWIRDVPRLDTDAVSMEWLRVSEKKKAQDRVLKKNAEKELGFTLESQLLRHFNV